MSEKTVGIKKISLLPKSQFFSFFFTKKQDKQQKIDNRNR